MKLLLLAALAAAFPHGDLAKAAADSADGTVAYDPAYVRGGDPGPGKGVCTDVVVRAYRKLGVDLQKEVNADMTAAFEKYPKRWGRKSPDPSIDHRRVPNLMTFFTRKGGSLPLSDYRPGDLVVWDLGGGVLHIGMVVAGGKIAHHIGGMGPVVEDVLGSWKVVGHYRYPR